MQVLQGHGASGTGTKWTGTLEGGADRLEFAQGAGVPASLSWKVGVGRRGQTRQTFATCWKQEGLETWGPVLPPPPLPAPPASRRGHL